MLEISGWLGGMLLAACGLPQAIKSCRQKHSHGLSIWFLLMWLGGEVLVLAYVLPKWHWPLIFNYGANIILVIVILYYKLWPKGLASQAPVEALDLRVQPRKTHN
ncbi:SemiSWEET family sugar transporter [Nitrospirota bacterium]